MIEQIIKANLERIEKDLTEISDIEKIDFIDIFPTSENNRLLLDSEASQISKLIKKTERGNVYLLNKPINTKYGELSLFKVRFYDKTRTNWEAAADFFVKDRTVLKNKVGIDDRFTYIERTEWNAIEFKTKDTLIYFLETLASIVYLGSDTFDK